MLKDFKETLKPIMLGMLFFVLCFTMGGFIFIIFDKTFHTCIDNTELDEYSYKRFVEKYEESVKLDCNPDISKELSDDIITIGESRAILNQIEKNKLKKVLIKHINNE